MGERIARAARAMISCLEVYSGTVLNASHKKIASAHDTAGFGGVVILRTYFPHVDCLATRPRKTCVRNNSTTVKQGPGFTPTVRNQFLGIQLYSSSDFRPAGESWRGAPLLSYHQNQRLRKGKTTTIWEYDWGARQRFGVAVTRSLKLVKHFSAPRRSVYIDLLNMPWWGCYVPGIFWTSFPFMRSPTLHSEIRHVP